MDRTENEWQKALTKWHLSAIFRVIMPTIMKKFAIIPALVVGLLAAASYGVHATETGQSVLGLDLATAQHDEQSAPEPIQVGFPVSDDISLQKKNSEIFKTSSDDTNGFVAPIDHALSRITKKDFGIKISPGHSPVPNDRFSGYHTGVDFETTPDEANKNVAVNAVCVGPLHIKEWAKGYGGVVVQECSLAGSTIYVVYGHLNVDSVTAKVGDILAPGDYLGNLGEGYSHQTDGVRKHLHLSIYKSEPLDIRGYVPEEQDLTKWLNPCLLICKE